MGIGADVFWNLTVKTLRPYLIAQNLKTEQQNYFMWLQGAYVYQAVSVVVSNALSKRGAKKQEYLKEPVRITPLTEEEKRIKAERERQKIIAMFNAMEKDYKQKG